MGNTPTKEARPRSSSLHSFGGSGAGPAGSRTSRRHTMSSSSAVSTKSSSKSEERLKAKEKHARDLVVRYQENVDGGYLAPFGTYKSNVDFDTQIVRGLIEQRRLAPFYTPLQDFDPGWSDDEIVKLVRQNPLHAVDSAYAEEDADDADDHKIHRSQNYCKRQEQKKRLREMLLRVKGEQEKCENEYFDALVMGVDPNLASRNLVLKLYRNATECPICFLYFPAPLNYSRCCGQPICSECFVQIKRLDPHPPHDEPESQRKGDELPHTLISEPSSCPYCAMADFGVTYDPPRDVHVGRGADLQPSAYAEKSSIEVIPEDGDAVEFCENPSPNLNASSAASPRKPRRRSSVAAESDLVIMTDVIRPGWEQQLSSAKSRLARKAAAASAIHASSLIINTEGTSARPGQSQTPAYLMSLEDRMIEEAMKLSLLEEEERLAKRDREARSNH